MWLSLFPPSSSGAGRLEILDFGEAAGGGDQGTRRHYQIHGERKVKVVRLSELISVLRLPPNAEACPEKTSAFCVETPDKTMVFAAQKEDAADWVDKLCLSTFQKEESSSSNQLHMEENQIYQSADVVPEFWIVVQKTEASTRCALQGAYWLEVGREALRLRETQKKNVVGEWPYELLRRYGKDKMALTIEAGRRCNSGPGTFTFETQQAENIFSLIQSTIKRKTSSVKATSPSQDLEKVSIANIQANSPLPRIPDMTSMAAILENKLSTLQRKPEEETQEESAPPAPITLMPLPSVPPHNGSSGGPRAGQSDAIYADPVECLPSAIKPISTTALYVDPASVLPLKPPGSAIAPLKPPSDPHPARQMELLDSEYAEVYDKVSPDRSGKNPLIDNAREKQANSEPIYTEPMSQKDKTPPKTEAKPDPFAHLYAQVCKTRRSPSPSSSPNTPRRTDNTTTKHPEDDVIYENLGVI